MTLDMLRQSGATQDDTEGLTDYTRMVQGVEIGILLRKRRRSEVKISLRSNEYADVSTVAKFLAAAALPCQRLRDSAAIADAKSKSSLRQRRHCKDDAYEWNYQFI